jgi:hypothetical protein
MGFQTQVNQYPAIGIAGDYASANPRAAYPSPEGGFVAGAGGVTVGRFVWVQADGFTVLNTGTGAPDGFIHREQQALITTYLAESGLVIPAGFPVTVMRTGDYLATATVAGATRGQKAFAKLADGTMQAAAAGATVAGFVETAFAITRTCLVNELTSITL